jgi:hypothetical protein
LLLKTTFARGFGNEVSEMVEREEVVHRAFALADGISSPDGGGDIVLGAEGGCKRSVAARNPAE